MRPNFVFLSLLGTAASLGVLSGAARAATAAEHWEVFSLTAEGITGDIDLSSESVQFSDGQVLRLSYAGSSSGVSVWPGDQVAAIFRVTNPMDLKLLHGNTLCGEAPTYVSVLTFHDFSQDLRRMLILTFVKGAEVPNAGVDPNRFCASYTYVQKH